MDPVRRFGSNLFNFSAAESCFYTDASMLEHQYPDRKKFCFVEGDRYGLIIRSIKTNEDVSFRISHVEWSREDEILHWVLRPLDVEVAKNPSLKDIRCIIYNT